MGHCHRNMANIKYRQNIYLCFMMDANIVMCRNKPWQEIRDTWWHATVAMYLDLSCGTKICSENNLDISQQIPYVKLKCLAKCRIAGLSSISIKINAQKINQSSDRICESRIKSYFVEFISSGYCQHNNKHYGARG